MIELNEKFEDYDNLRISKGNIYEKFPFHSLSIEEVEPLYGEFKLVNRKGKDILDLFIAYQGSKIRLHFSDDKFYYDTIDIDFNNENIVKYVRVSKDGKGLIYKVRNDKYDLEKHVSLNICCKNSPIISYDRNLLKESMDIVTIENGDDLNSLGIFDYIKAYYGSRVALLFRDWTNSDAYANGNFKLRSDANNPLSKTSIESYNSKYFADMFESLGGNDVILFKTMDGEVTPTALTSKYLKNNLNRIESTENDVIFYGDNHVLMHVNEDEPINYDSQLYEI